MRWEVTDTEVRGLTTEQPTVLCTTKEGEKLEIRRVVSFDGPVATYLHKRSADLPPAVGTRRPSPRQGMPGEPTIDDVAGPRTLPMFADDDEPDNGKDLSSRRSGWLDTRDSSRRR